MSTKRQLNHPKAALITALIALISLISLIAIGFRAAPIIIGYQADEGRGEAVRSNTEPSLEDVDLASLEIVAGQTIYVPVYSYIYHYTSVSHTMNLSTTLSIRNTDSRFPIFVKSVQYFGTNGEPLKEYLENPIRLDALASSSFFVDVNDITGGAGAKFIVEWVSEAPAFEPIVEAVMISTESTQGISFSSSGRVLSSFSTPE